MCGLKGIQSMEYAGIWTSEQEFIKNKFDSVSGIRMLDFEMLNLKMTAKN